jgi:hypothetical protein
LILDFRFAIGLTETRASLLTSAIGNHKSAIENASVWVVAQLAEHRNVTAATEGSTPFDPPNSFSIFDFRLPIDCRNKRMMPGL